MKTFLSFTFSTEHSQVAGWDTASPCWVLSTTANTIFNSIRDSAGSFHKEENDSIAYVRHFEIFQCRIVTGMCLVDKDQTNEKYNFVNATEVLLAESIFS